MTVSGIVKMITADSVGGRNKTMHVLYIDGNMLLNIKQVGPGPVVCVCVSVCLCACACACVFVRACLCGVPGSTPVHRTASR